MFRNPVSVCQPFMLRFGPPADPPLRYNDAEQSFRSAARVLFRQESNPRRRLFHDHFGLNPPRAEAADDVYGFAQTVRLDMKIEIPQQGVKMLEDRRAGLEKNWR